MRRQVPVVVAVRVDEAGSERLAGAVDDRIGRRAGEPAHRGDGVPGDSDRTVRCRAAGAVIDGDVGDQQSARPR